MFKIQTRRHRKPIVVYTKADAKEKADQWHRYARDLRIRFYKPIYERETFPDTVDRVVEIMLYVYGIGISIFLYLNGRR